jgi:1,4-alpha-glucan branching enzyme
MFLMGEEVVAQKPYRYDNVAEAKEDLLGERAGAGARMFRYYQDLIRLSRDNRAVRSHNVDVLHTSDRNRVICFTRREGTTDVLVAASLNNRPFDHYTVEAAWDRLPAGEWAAIFNSDAETYGGSGASPTPGPVIAANGRIDLRLPANGVVVLQRR